MTTMMRRLRKIEGALAPRGGKGHLQLRIGPLKRLPEDYIGERHIAILNRRARQGGGEDCEFEERPGPPSPDADEDDGFIHIYLVSCPGPPVFKTIAQ